MSSIKIIRRIKGGKWYLHIFTKHANELSFSTKQTFWARYSNINRYSKVIKTESYKYNFLSRFFNLKG